MSRKKTLSAGLSRSDREALARLIAAETERTAARVTALTRDLAAIVESAGSASVDDEHDPEGATLAFERAQVAALLAQARSHLAELAAADERLRGGAYGICEDCGQPIARERLHARPTARACVGCAARQAR